MNLFIDTNILLSFYHLTSEDIEELKKLVALIEEGEISLLLPEQIEHEFYRNRETKISDAVKKLREARFKLQFPAFCKDYEEFRQLKKTLRTADEQHSNLVNKVLADATAGNLAADAIVTALFKKATRIIVDDALIARAAKRVQLGNPPGKNGSLGDAINWEALLSAVPKGDELYFVSADSDHVSSLENNKLSEYLLREWGRKNVSQIFFYRQISDFFREKFPKIELASEVAKDLLIQRLAQSGSFAQTHLYVAKLLNYEDFTPPQTEQLISIAESNNQVGWVVGDDDLQALYSKLLEGNAMKLTAEVRRRLENLVQEEEARVDDDIPF